MSFKMHCSTYLGIIRKAYYELFHLEKTQKGITVEFFLSFLRAWGTTNEIPSTFEKCQWYIPHALLKICKTFALLDTT